MSLTVGHISYLNCAPFFHYLREEGFSGPIQPGVPAELNRRLAAGEIDVSPSSSFEYGCHWRRYLLLPGLSISSLGPVQSVLLFTERPLEELRGEEIALTGESATSVNLLKVLLREYYGFSQVPCRVPEGPVEETLSAGGPALLIGDRALRAARSAKPSMQIYDLGEIWYRQTGLPFVFALWILRREAAEMKSREVLDLTAKLGRSRTRALGALETLAAEFPERQWLGEQGLLDYWRCMSYDLTEAHLEGLRLFFHLCVRHGLLAEEPELHFFP